MSEPQFAELFEEFAKQRQLEEGTDLLAEVRDINDNFVIVNAGLKSEASIPREEFQDTDGQLLVQKGDEVEVEIELLENGRGEAVLSRRNTLRKRALQSVQDAMDNDGVLEGTVTGRVRGGYSVNLEGIRAFLPGSLVDIFPQSDSSTLVGQTIEVRPIKFNPARNSLVVSRRAVMERAMLDVKDGGAMETVTEGARMRGTVKAVVEYGAFVEIAAGIYGLMHITDISWKHTTSINEALSVGQEVEVMVLGVDKEKGRISLGMKQLQPNPWEYFDRTHPAGSRMFGKVTRAMEYGVFVEVEDGVQGLVHSSEMSWTRKNINPLKSYSPGDEVEVMILEIDAERRRISLGIKQCTPNPWQDFAAAHRKGDRLTAKVRSVSTEFGLFMELDGGIDGLVRLTELSYDEPGETALRKYKKGDEAEVVVLSIDAERERIGLGIKQLESGGFDEFVEQHLHSTQGVRGKITAIVEKGAQVELEGGVRGFLPIGEIAEQRVENIGDFLKEGEEHEFILIKGDARNMQAVLSIKEMIRQQREQAMQERKKEAQAQQGPTLGALISAKMREESGEKGSSDEAAKGGADSSSAEKAAKPEEKGGGDAP